METIDLTDKQKQNFKKYKKHIMDKYEISEKEAEEWIDSFCKAVGIKLNGLVKESRETFLYPNPHEGDTIRIIHMDDDNGKDITAQKYAGREGVIEYIDDEGQLHGSWGSLAIIPDVDTFEIIKCANTTPLDELYVALLSEVNKVKAIINYFTYNNIHINGDFFEIYDRMSWSGIINSVRKLGNEEFDSPITSGMYGNRAFYINDNEFYAKDATNIAFINNRIVIWFATYNKYVVTNKIPRNIIKDIL